jgi:eukaryotic-like serine/threonine-protein kinase
MANPDPVPVSDGLIDKRYAVDGSRSLPSVGGLLAYRASDQLTGRTDLMALQVQRQFPVRPRAFEALTAPVDGLLTPLAYGAVAAPGGGEEVCYAVCVAPPGPTVESRRGPWPEAELIECVLRPAAHVLEYLQARGLTHRSIRLDNVYQIGPGQPVVLGNAWATPPGMAQPALFEPPYSIMCPPCGRGDGSIADDVYALGVLLLCLALGRAPLAQLDAAAILRRKLEQGSYGALASDERLPPIIGDLVRGMLAEDPEHRPTPMLLLDPASARGRRVAARPPRRAQRAIVMAGGEIWDERSLARAMAVEPEQALHALRNFEIVHWLRRGVGDGGLAARLEELARHRSYEEGPEDANADPSLVMRAIALMDPLAPLCWRGVVLWPNALGTALAAAFGSDPDVVSRLEELIGGEETGSWAMVRIDRCDFATLRAEARQHHVWLQQRGQTNGVDRLIYLLNPLIPCTSPLLGGRWVARMVELMPALEETAEHVDQKQTAPVDSHIAAFISARLERRLESELGPLSGIGAPDVVCLGQFRMLAQMQVRYHNQPLPALAAWLAARAGPVLATWRSRDRRSAVAERIEELAKAGYLSPMVTALDDPTARSVDAREAYLATEELRQIDTALVQLSNGGAGRAAAAQRLGQEIAAGLGLAALATTLVLAALG